MLKIYRSSAGSGKTYTLMKLFIELAIENVHVTDRTLIVTFTNEATCEIKDRIVKTLYDMIVSTDNQLAYDLADGLNMPLTDIRSKADKLLKHILHNYDYFHVSTIDSFLQLLMNSFMYEIGLNQYGSKIELQTQFVENYVTDDLIKKTTHDNRLFQWLCKYVDHKIANGQSVNIRNSLLSMSEVLFSNNLNFEDTDVSYDRILGRLHDEQKYFEDNVKTFASDIIEIVSNSIYTISDFAYGDRGIVGCMRDVANGNRYELSEKIRMHYAEISTWIAKKKTDNSNLVSVIVGKLIPVTHKMMQFYELHIERYLSNAAILKTFYFYGLIKEMYDSLRSYRTKYNVLLIDDVPRILSQIVEGNDIHFIFEKLGVKIDHVIIDEFQDVSLSQWNIIKPLVQNSVSQGKTSIIVGDSKQSIYRWRGGSSELLECIVPNEIRSEIHKLERNWRSRKNVIEFNNNFFRQSNSVLQQYLSRYLVCDSDRKKLDDMSRSYDELEQEYVDINDGFDGEAHTEVCGDDDEILKKMTDTVVHLISIGENDIAILVRDNKAEQAVMDYVQRHTNININSNSSSKMTEKMVIQFIIDALRYIFGDKNDVTKLELRLLYDTMFPECDIDITSQLDTMNSISSLYDKVVNIAMMTKNNIHDESVCLFLDIVRDYQFSGKDEDDFLLWWDVNKNGFCIRSNCDVAGVQVMTVHKSKGLEFKNVIVLCDWEFDYSVGHLPVMWCEYDDLTLPVQYTKSLVDTCFSSKYMCEKIYIHYDNLNLMYVAFTRAMDRLFVFHKHGNDNSRIDSNVLISMTSSVISC